MKTAALSWIASALVSISVTTLAGTPAPATPQEQTSPSTSTSNTVPRVEIDYSKAPECEAFARRAHQLVEEWYPRVRELLSSEDQQPPPATIRLVFEPMRGVAHASRGVIHISAQWVTGRGSNDYGMVIHEMTHLVQGYRGGGEGWLTEGIADYIRLHHFEPEARRPRIDPDKASYRDSYKTTAMFLIWLEKKSPGIVRKLNAASRRHDPVMPVFKEVAGADVDALWKEFTDTLREPKAAE